MSSSQRRYLLDTNVFIEAKNRYYSFETVPGFWEWLEVARAEGVVISIDKVKEELIRSKDELAQWAKDHPDFFCSTGDAECIKYFGELSRWAYDVGNNYSKAAKVEFTKGDIADPYLVAYARAYECVVVTHEKPASDGRKRIKIPDACQAIGVDYIDIFSVMKKEKVCLTLSSNPYGLL